MGAPSCTQVPLAPLPEPELCALYLSLLSCVWRVSQVSEGLAVPHALAQGRGQGPWPPSQASTAAGVKSHCRCSTSASLTRATRGGTLPYSPRFRPPQLHHCQRPHQRIRPRAAEEERRCAHASGPPAVAVFRAVLCRSKRPRLRSFQPDQMQMCIDPQGLLERREARGGSAALRRRLLGRTPHPTPLRRPGARSLPRRRRPARPRRR